jgi:hypothetical protein
VILNEIQISNGSNEDLHLEFELHLEFGFGNWLFLPPIAIERMTG